MGTLVILKLPKWLESTDGWGLMLPHNDIPALFKVTAFTVEGCRQEEVSKASTTEVRYDWLCVWNAYGIIQGMISCSCTLNKLHNAGPRTHKLASITQQIIVSVMCNEWTEGGCCSHRNWAYQGELTLGLLKRCMMTLTCTLLIHKVDSNLMNLTPLCSSLWVDRLYREEGTKLWQDELYIIFFFLGWKTIFILGWV